MKKIAFAIILSIVLVIVTGCTIDNNPRMTTAMIRYFDGSTESVLVNQYWVGSGGVYTIFTDQGRKILIGQNNVILIEESEAQYYGFE